MHNKKSVGATYAQWGDIAKDLLAKVFVRVWQDIDLYNPDTHRIFTWILLITNKMVIERTGNHIDTIVGDLLAGIIKDKF